MIPKKIKIDNCRDCVFNHENSFDGSSSCNFPGDYEFTILSTNVGDPAPENCPLRKYAVSVELNLSEDLEVPKKSIK